jgi:tRNA A-37 threonylcarbamoyl transferase component Bud32
MEQWRGIADRVFGTAVGTEGLTSGLDEAMKKGAVLKNGSKSFVSHVELGGAEVVIKGYRHLGWLHSLRHSIKGSRAYSSWLLAHDLMRLGVPTPQPLAFIDVYKGFMLWRSYFIYEYVEGPSLHEIMKDPNTTKERKLRLIDHVLSLLRCLSEHGISHGDLKHTNMICRGDQIAFIDLDALRPVIGPAFIRRWRYERDKTRFLKDVKSV